MADSMVDAPAQMHRQSATSGIYQRTAGILLVVLIALLVGASLYWLQWSSQRGITLGYPKPNVQITSAATGTSLIRSALQFSAQSPGRDIHYTWQFGDGSADTGSAVTHAYTANGNFTVSVTAYDPINQSSTITTNVTIVPPPPQATFTLSSNYYGYGYVTFDASGSSADPSTSIASYNWNFGDGSSDSSGYNQENHTYYSVGTYQVTLVVTDATGQSSSVFTANVTIY